MLDEVHTKILGGSAIFWYYFSFVCDESIEGGAICKLRSRLLVTAGGSLRFDCQHPATRRIRSRRHPFRIAAANKKILVRSISAKKRDSKPWVDKTPDIGKWSGVGSTHKNIRLTLEINWCSLLAGLYCRFLATPYIRGSS